MICGALATGLSGNSTASSWPALNACDNDGGLAVCCTPIRPPTPVSVKPKDSWIAGNCPKMSNSSEKPASECVLSNAIALTSTARSLQFEHAGVAVLIDSEVTATLDDACVERQANAIRRLECEGNGRTAAEVELEQHAEPIDGRGKRAERDTERCRYLHRQSGEAAALRIEAEVDQLQVERTCWQVRHRQARAQPRAVDETQLACYVGLRGNIEPDGDAITEDEFEETVRRLDDDLGTVARRTAATATPLASFSATPSSSIEIVTPSASLPILSALPLRLRSRPIAYAPLTATPPGGATGTSTSTPALAVNPSSTPVPSMGCERFSASAIDALIALGGPTSKASDPFNPPGAASDNVGFPANDGMTCWMKPAAALDDGAVNERSTILPTSSATMPNRGLCVGKVGRRVRTQQRRELVRFVTRRRVCLRITGQHQQHLADRERTGVTAVRLQLREAIDLLHHRTDDGQRCGRVATVEPIDRLLHIPECSE